MMMLLPLSCYFLMPLRCHADFRWWCHYCFSASLDWFADITPLLIDDYATPPDAFTLLMLRFLSPPLLIFRHWWYWCCRYAFACWCRWCRAIIAGWWWPTLRHWYWCCDIEAMLMILRHWCWWYYDDAASDATFTLIDYWIDYWWCWCWCRYWLPLLRHFALMLSLW